MSPSAPTGTRAIAKVALPAGLSPCPSTKSKRSSPNVACTLGVVAGRGATVRPYDIYGYSISLYESDSYIGVGRAITLSAYANLDVGPTPYYIEFYDAYTGAQIGYCAYGSSCSTSISMSGATTHGFIAYIGSWSGTNPPGTVAATSNGVACTWMAISYMTVSPQYLAPYSATTITVYSSTDVGPSPYWLEIFDSTTGANLAICARGWSCSASETQYGATVHGFASYISSYGTGNPPPNVQSSTSNYAVWLSVSISASPLALAPGGTTSLVATTNADVGPSPYWISIFDTTTNYRVALCGAGTSCSANFTSYGSTIRDFFAYIGGSGTSAPPPPVLVSSSNYAEVTWMTITLQVTPPLVAINGSATLTANVSLSVTYSVYYIQLYDQTTLSFITECPSGSSCSTSVPETTATTQTFVAYVNCCGTTFPPSGARAVSNSASASWVSVAIRACNYSVTSCPSASWTNGTVTNGSVTLMATATASVSGTGYNIQVVDQGTGVVVAGCAAGSSCAFPVSESAAGKHTFIAQVAVPYSYPPVVPAQSGGVSLMWVQAWKPWAKDSSASGFGGSSQWDYSDDPSGSAFEFGVDVGLVSLVAGSQIYAPEPGVITYIPCNGLCWYPGRLLEQLDSGAIIGFGHVKLDPRIKSLPVHVDGGQPIATVGCNGTNCSNSHVEFMYDSTAGSTSNIWNFRPPASASAPVTSMNGCPRNTYSTSDGTSVDPCAWLSAYLLFGS